MTTTNGNGHNPRRVIRLKDRDEIVTFLKDRGVSARVDDDPWPLNEPGPSPAIELNHGERHRSWLKWEPARGGWWGQVPGTAKGTVRTWDDLELLANVLIKLRTMPADAQESLDQIWRTLLHVESHTGRALAETNELVRAALGLLDDEPTAWRLCGWEEIQFPLEDLRKLAHLVADQIGQLRGATSERAR